MPKKTIDTSNFQILGGTNDFRWDEGKGEPVREDNGGTRLALLTSGGAVSLDGVWLPGTLSVWGFFRITAGPNVQDPGEAWYWQGPPPAGKITLVWLDHEKYNAARNQGMIPNEYWTAAFPNTSGTYGWGGFAAQATAAPAVSTWYRVEHNLTVIAWLACPGTWAQGPDFKKSRWYATQSVPVYHVGMNPVVFHPDANGPTAALFGPIL